MTEMHSDVYGVQTEPIQSSSIGTRQNFLPPVLAAVMAVGAVLGVMLGYVVAIVCGAAAILLLVMALAQKRKPKITIEAPTKKSEPTSWSKDSP